MISVLDYNPLKDNCLDALQSILSNRLLVHGILQKQPSMEVAGFTQDEINLVLERMND